MNKVKVNVDNDYSKTAAMGRKTQENIGDFYIKETKPQADKVLFERGPGQTYTYQYLLCTSLTFDNAVAQARKYLSKQYPIVNQKEYLSRLCFNQDKRVWHVYINIECESEKKFMELRKNWIKKNFSEFGPAW